MEQLLKLLISLPYFKLLDIVPLNSGAKEDFPPPSLLYINIRNVLANQKASETLYQN